MADTTYERLPELTDFPPEERIPAVELLLRICHQERTYFIEQIRQRDHLLRVQAEQLHLQSIEIQRHSEVIALQAEQIRMLKDEIAVLKGEKGRPKISPSALNKDNKGQGSGGQKKRGKR